MLDRIVWRIKGRTECAIMGDPMYLEVGSGNTRWNVDMGIGIDTAKGYEGHENFPTVLASGEALPFKDGTFNNVCFFDSLEHIPNYGLAIDEAHRVLNKDGILSIIDPNDRSLKILRFLTGRFKKAIVGNPDHINVFVGNDIAEVVGFRFKLLKRLNKIMFVAYKFKKV